MPDQDTQYEAIHPYLEDLWRGSLHSKTPQETVGKVGLSKEVRMRPEIKHMLDMAFDGPIEYEAITPKPSYYAPNLAKTIDEDVCLELELEEFDLEDKVELRAQVEEVLQSLLHSGNVFINVKESDGLKHLQVLELIGCLYTYALSVNKSNLAGGHLSLELISTDGNSPLERLFLASYTMLNVYMKGLDGLRLYNALAEMDGKETFPLVYEVDELEFEDFLPIFPLSTFNLSIFGLEQLAFHGERLSAPIDVENQAMLLYNMKYTGSLALTRAASLLSSLGLRTKEDISDEFVQYSSWAREKLHDVVRVVVQSSPYPEEVDVAWSPIEENLFYCS